MNRTGLLIVLAVFTAFQTARADELEDLQAKKKLDDARTEAYTAEAKRIKAESDLKKAVADASVSQLASDASLATQEANTEYAKFQALKAVFGTLPEIGKTGNLTIGSTDPVLLATRSSSASSTIEAAEQICANLKAAKVTKAVVVPDDLQSKLIEARWLKSVVAANLKSTNDSINSQPKTAFVAEVATVAVAAKYLIGVAQDFSKLVRADRALTTKDDFVLTRRQLFEWVLPTSCGNEVFATANTNMDRINRGWDEVKSIADDIGKIDKNVYDLTVRKNDSLRVVAATQRLMSDKTALLSKYTTCAEDEKKSEAERKSCAAKADPLRSEIDDANKQKDQYQKMADDDSQLILKVSPWLASIAANPKTIADAGYWIAFGDSVKDSDWISYVLEGQDVQQVQDGAFTGKRLYGTGTIEVRFKAMSPTGISKTTGFVSITQAPRRIDLDKGEYNLVKGFVTAP
ncbi:hypothetical protein GCM10028785_27270 [Hydrogenophaga soli]